MKNTDKLLSIFAVAAFLAACGGASVTNKKGMTKLAGDAPPPPSGEAKTIDRTVTRAVEKDFPACKAPGFVVGAEVIQNLLATAHGKGRDQ